MVSASYLAMLVFLAPAALTIAYHRVAVGFELALAMLLAAASFAGVLWIIPKCIPAHVRARLSGVDINKKGNLQVPESMGLEAAAVFLLSLTAISAFVAHKELLYPAIIAIALTALLGFADDVLNIPWRVKIAIPFVSSLPLVLNYSGSRTVCLRGFLSPLASLLDTECLDIGALYLVYIVCLFVFCTHSINIYAGINGLEAGQSFVVGCFLLFHCVTYYNDDENSRIGTYILLPFIATTFALLFFNWYPSRVFVGDTFTLTAGAVIAAVGTIGHFAEMTLLFMLPQLINFTLSLPQLVGIVKCQRHRLPRLNEQTMKLEGKKENLNLVNYWLLIFGPKTEKRLCVELMIFQGVCCLLAYVIKYFYNKSMSP